MSIESQWHKVEAFRWLLHPYGKLGKRTKSERDSQRKRCYEAERAVFECPKYGEGRTFKDDEEVADYLTEIINQQWFQTKFGSEHEVHVRVSTRMHPVNACYRGRTNEIILGTECLTEWLVLHEFAHYLNKIKDRRLGGHGSYYCRAYLEILKHQLPKHHKQLKKEFEKRKVKTTPNNLDIIPPIYTIGNLTFKPPKIKKFNLNLPKAGAVIR